MKREGTFDSVTKKPCKCGYLERSANDPVNPIIFDKELNEFNFKYEQGSLRIYHCPFCGGTAPKSKRDSLFATIAHDEKERIFALTSGIKTLAEAIDRFGKPERDDAKGLTIETPASKGKSVKVETFRVLTYENLSKTADVWFIDYLSNGIQVSIQGKYIGRQNSGA